jgi:hypothetical protein
MNSMGAERNKGKIRIENTRMSHPIAPKGHKEQKDNENAPEGYRISLVYRNSKGESRSIPVLHTHSNLRLQVLGHSAQEERKDFFVLSPLPHSAVFFDLPEEVFFLFGPFAFATTALGKLSNAKSMPCSLISLRAKRIRKCGYGGA